MSSYPGNEPIEESDYLLINRRYNEITRFPDHVTMLVIDGVDEYELPPFPPGLITLRYSNSKITTLPQLPDSLTLLACYSIKINLPILPPNLTSLAYARNNLTVLPELPDSLESLTVIQNELTVLPRLPDRLQQLSCRGNKLIILPELPDRLLEFDCSNNKLTILPELPTGLQQLICSDNKLTALPTLPTSLDHLECRGNNFSKKTYVQLVGFYTVRGNQTDELEWAQSRLDEITSDLKHLSRVKNSAPDKAADPLGSIVGEFLGDDSIRKSTKGGTKRRKRRRTKRKKNKRTTRKR